MNKKIITALIALGSSWFSAQALADPTYNLGLIKQFNYQGFNTVITGINDSGQAIGYYTYQGTSGAIYRSMLISGFDRNDTSKNFTYKGLQFSPYGSLILGISSNGLIAGVGYFQSALSAGTLIAGGLYGKIGTAYKTLPFSFDVSSTATGINAKGVVTCVVGNGGSYSYIIQPGGKMTRVAVPGADPNFTQVNGINDAGDVVGIFYPDSKNTNLSKGFIRHANGTYAVIFPTFGKLKTVSAEINGINRQGDVVGDVTVLVSSGVSQFPRKYPFLRTADGKIQYFDYTITLNGLDSADDLVGSVGTNLGPYATDAIIIIPDPVSKVHK